MKKHYIILGLKEGASQEEIQTAFERLSKELDPKNNDNQEFFIEEYKKVQKAYQALSNSSILATEKGARIGTSDKKSFSTKKTKIISPMRPTSKNTSLTKKILAGVAIMALIIFGVTYTVTNASSPPNPVYLDENGITIKAQKWAKIGDQGTIDDILYTIVDKDSLLMMIEKGYLVNRVCTSLITDMSKLFDGKTAFNQDISNWDVSNVNNMNGMFRNAQSFNQPIDIWNVSNVTQMEEMFSGSYSFNQPIGSWNVSKVNSMEAMFSGGATKNTYNKEQFGIKYPRLDSNFNQDIGSWNVSNVRNMDLMFAIASSFNQDISSWNVSNVTKMSGMFYDASSFNQDLSSWDVTNVKTTYFYLDYYYNSVSFAEGTPSWNLPKPNLKYN
ncbi:BspA family leucine-rich repeat surface protein [Flavobacteriaceae bacterium]|nr:BspA family leucine-rich repeat surface protein [Flavobacteriaceae bacterium]